MMCWLLMACGLHFSACGVQKFPKLSKSGLSLLNGLLTYDPERRLTARQALRHPYFSEFPLAKLPQDMPYFPSAHDAAANDDQHKRYWSQFGFACLQAIRNAEKSISAQAALSVVFVALKCIIQSASYVTQKDDQDHLKVFHLPHAG